MNKEKINIIGTNQTIKNSLEIKGYDIEQFGRFTKPSIDFTSENLKSSIKKILETTLSNKFLILSGLLQEKKISEQSKSEIINSHLINSVGPVILCESILEKISNAQIILLGSESGFKGSYDLSYALAKSSLKMYVKQRQVKVNQKLLLISPSTIDDFGMTLRRKDFERLELYRAKHPKKRFLESEELACMIDFLFKFSVYLTNTEIELNGGKFSLMKYS